VLVSKLAVTLPEGFSTWTDTNMPNSHSRWVWPDDEEEFLEPHDIHDLVTVGEPLTPEEVALAKVVRFARVACTPDQGAGCLSYDWMCPDWRLDLDLDDLLGVPERVPPYSGPIHLRLDLHAGSLKQKCCGCYSSAAAIARSVAARAAKLGMRTATPERRASAATQSNDLSPDSVMVCSSLPPAGRSPSVPHSFASSEAFFA
jgi:hypothetical protein